MSSISVRGDTYVRAREVARAQGLTLAEWVERLIEERLQQVQHWQPSRAPSRPRRKSALSVPVRGGGVHLL